MIKLIKKIDINKIYKKENNKIKKKIQNNISKNKGNILKEVQSLYLLSCYLLY